MSYLHTGIRGGWPSGCWPRSITEKAHMSPIPRARGGQRRRRLHHPSSAIERMHRIRLAHASSCTIFFLLLQEWLPSQVSSGVCAWAMDGYPSPLILTLLLDHWTVHVSPIISMLLGFSFPGHIWRVDLWYYIELHAPASFYGFLSFFFGIRFSDSFQRFPATFFFYHLNFLCARLLKKDVYRKVV